MNHLTRTHSKLLSTAAIVGIALSLTLTGCSSSAEPASQTSNIAADWGACMRDAGFDVEDPDPKTLESGAVISPPGADNASFTKAANSCSEEVGVTPPSGTQNEKWKREYAQVAACIRENGYEDFPEQQEGVLDTSNYPRAQEAQFDQVFSDCLEQFSPSTQTTN